jgi:hypothetical protein
MLKEKDCPREDRLLPIVCTIPKKMLPTKESIEQFIKGKQISNENLIGAYLTWKQGHNELIAYTGYRYCDTSIPKSYNFLLDFESPEGGHEINATIKYAIWNGYLPLDILDHGHKTICIISFDDKIPTELDSLLDWDNWLADKSSRLRFGLCDKREKDQILRKIKNGG